MIEHLEGRLGERWEQILDGEEDPFGEWTSEFEWRQRDLQTVLTEDGRALAAVGLLVAEVQAAGATFPVVGVGNVIVTHSRRGRGLLRQVMEPALERAAGLGPDFAMLFCSRANAPRYARFGFAEIGAPVTADQPGGPREMPRAVMWRPLRAGVSWPAGPIRVQGLPF